MTPELFTSAWWSALAAIIVIDLVLAGDNAIVIGLAARNVPREHQRKVVLWGTAGAIIVRVLLTTIVVWLLKVPAFLLIGGAALVWIAWKLTHSGDHGGPDIEGRASVGGAIRTIVIADAVMGVDNVLAVGGAAHGSLLLVVIGLAISVPIVIWGSTLVLKWVERFPQIMWFGAAILGWTAAKMIASEPLLKSFFEVWPAARVLLSVAIVGGLIVPPIWRTLSVDGRAKALVLAVLVVWLAGWGYVEDRLGMTFDPIDGWQWDNEIIDLIRWVGWIPVALLVHRRALRARTAG
ncbi:MAG: TerC family protein [Proteobacteria bacterium]|nr:TerC family protein [Pseudomonadota bacterium]